MKIIRLSVTDTFLWDIYNVAHTAGELMGFILNPKAIKFRSGLINPVFAKYRKEKGAKEFSKLIYYLKRKDYISVEKLRSNKGFIITKKGLSKIFKASFAIGEKPKRKDGKWIMVIFDIPQKYSKSRALLRSVFRNLGYKMFQQSVWVTPYDVSKKTEQLLQHYSLDEFVKIFLIEKL